MAYAVAFFGVSWPDRVVKRRLFKWLMRGPVTASSVLALTTIVRRFGERFGQPYSGAVPVVTPNAAYYCTHPSIAVDAKKIITVAAHCVEYGPNGKVFVNRSSDTSPTSKTIRVPWR